MIAYAGYTDNELTTLIHNGDEPAFAELYNRYWQELYDTAYRRLQNREQVKDIIQDIFVRLWIRRAELQIENPQAYLHTAVRFQVFKYVERESTHQSSFEPFESIAYSSFSADEKILQQELLDLVQAYIESLPGKRKQIFLMHIKENLSTKEIADRLNISQKTVQNQLATSMQGLHNKIAPIIIAIAAASLQS
ncbi:MAG TPA: sigma-70 family RNA polymerase sigma factor [Ferruginibacter sp.]|nr:sigma-70 family RNA polymerase sigma factor [Ferruginibacter sp.]